VSDLALRILHPMNPEEKIAALREAAVQPPLFRELAEFEGASDENLVARLVRSGFTEIGAKLAVASYRETISLAPAESPAYDSTHESEDTVLATQPVTLTPTSGGVPPETPKAGNTINLDLPDGTRVQLYLSGGSLTKDALDLVRQYLDLLEKTAAITAVAADAKRAKDTSEASPAPSDPNGTAQHSEQSQTDAPD
jgi:hypothetical protein